MSYALDLRLENQTDGDLEVVIPKGTVFEGVETTRRVMQNLKTVAEHRLTLGPRLVVTLHLEGRCINGGLPAPSNWRMQPTVFVQR